MKSWYSIEAKKDGEAEVYIYDDIGSYGVTAQTFIKDLKASKSKKPLIRINSYGGEIFQAFPIFNHISELDATARIDGIAASSASYIAMAAKRIEIAENGYLHIHNPWNLTAGDADAHRQTAQDLEKFQKTFVSAYAKRTGNTDEKVQAWMDVETIFNAEEAKKYGFADAITSAVSFQANADKILKRFGRVLATFGGNLPPSNDNTQIKMTKLLLALVEAKLIPSADVSEDVAAAAFRGSWQALVGERDGFKSKLEAAESKEKQAIKSRAQVAVDAAVKDGRIKAESRDTFVSIYEADEQNGIKVLAAFVKPAGTEALTPPKDDEKKDDPKSTYDAWKTAKK